VAETELPGLILEDADPGRLVSRLVDAAAELHELNSNNCPNAVLSIERLSLIPVFKSAIGLPLPSD
jgi:aminoglycoside phosphotransferase